MWKKKSEPADDPAREVKPDKRKKGRKRTLILVLVLLPLLLGGVFGVLAAMGKIPGLTLARVLPKAKPIAANSSPKATGDGQKEKLTAAQSKAPKPAPRRAERQTLTAAPSNPLPDLDKGAKAMARIWERIDPERVAEMAGSYRDPQLARILNSMDSKKSAAILAVLDAKRAALLCQEMEKQASMPPTSTDQQAAAS